MVLERFLISILHDGDESWTLWAETGFVHTNSARQVQWKHSGRLQTLDLTKRPSRILGIFWICVKKLKNKKETENVGFTGGNSRGLVDRVVGNQIRGGEKLLGRKPKIEVLGWAPGVWATQGPPAGLPYFPTLV